MAKIELKGTIIIVQEPEQIGTNGLTKISVIFKVPGFVDGYGDKVGEDEKWKLDILGERINNLKPSKDWEGKKAKATVFLSSKEVVKNAGGFDFFYAINANLYAVDFAEPKKERE